MEDFRLHSSGVGGRRPECTLCWREDKREYSARDDIREYVYHYRRRDDIKAQRRARESTPRYKALKRAYDQRPDRKELRNERNASPQRRAVRQAYNQRHEVKERNKKRSSLYGGLYRKKRIKKNGLPSSVWRKILAYFDGCCAVCGKSPDEFTLIVVDHWNPISKGGEHVLTNIVPLCHCRKGGKGGCNRYKWNKDPYQWLTEEFGQAQAHEIEKRIQLYFEWIKENFL
ncbi:MAG: HNH endonuclease signature motif containing protein [Anaerolineae bacterium]